MNFGDGVLLSYFIILLICQQNEDRGIRRLMPIGDTLTKNGYLYLHQLATATTNLTPGAIQLATPNLYNTLQTLGQQNIKPQNTEM